MKSWIKKRFRHLKCQICRSKHVSWIIESPTKKDEFDMIPDPIGFCDSNCLEKFVHNYNSGGYTLEGPIRPKVIK